MRRSVTCINCNTIYSLCTGQPMKCPAQMYHYIFRQVGCLVLKEHKKGLSTHAQT